MYLGKRRAGQALEVSASRPGAWVFVPLSEKATLSLEGKSCHQNTVSSLLLCAGCCAEGLMYINGLGSHQWHVGQGERGRLLTVGRGSGIQN